MRATSKIGHPRCLSVAVIRAEGLLWIFLLVGAIRPAVVFAYEVNQCAESRGRREEDDLIIIRIRTNQIGYFRLTRPELARHSR